MEHRFILTPRYTPRMPERVSIGPSAVPALLMAPDAPGPHPAAIMQHGMASQKEDLLPLALVMASYGFVSLLPDAWGHGEHPRRDDVSRHASPSDYFVAVTRHTAHTLRAAITTLARRPEARPDAIIVGGFSMGAMASLIAGMEDPRAAGIVSIAGTPLPDLICESPNSPALPSDAACRWATRHDATTLVSRFAPRPLLISHGRADDMAPVAGALHLYDAARPYYAMYPERLGLMLYDHTHTVTPQQLDDVMQWMAPLFLADAEPAREDEAS